MSSKHNQRGFRAVDAVSMGMGTGGFTGATSAAAVSAGIVIPVTTRLLISVSGQSNSSGSAGTPALSTGSQAFGNVMVGNTTGHNTIVNLQAGSQEMPMYGLADWLSSRQSNRVSTSDSWGVGATAYSGLLSGTAPYGNGITAMRTAISDAQAAGSSTFSPVMVWIHGENDELANASSSQYADYLLDLQGDWQTDMRLLTTQSNVAVPVFYNQIANWSQNASMRNTSEVAQGQYQAHISSSNLVLVGPSYMLPFQSSGANLHYTNVGFRRAGEYMAKAIQKFVSGSTWTPVRPASITANGNSITLVLEGGDGSAKTIDTTNVAYRSFNGFSIVDPSSTGPHITAVSQSAANTFVISLTSTAHATTQLTYGLTTNNKATNGDIGNAWSAGGNIRDNDDAVGRIDGNPLYNWLICFRGGFDAFTAGAEPVVSYAAPTKSWSLSTSPNNAPLTVRQITALKGATSLLCSVWVRRTTSWGTGEVIIAANDTNLRMFDMRTQTSGLIRIFLPASANDTTRFWTSAGTTLAGNTWYNLVWYYDGGAADDLNKLRPYANGVFLSGSVSGGGFPTSLNSVDKDVEFGSTAATNLFGGSAGGNFSNFALWINPGIASASLPGIVTEIWNAGVPGDLNAISIGRPTHWWPLDGSLIDSGSSLPHMHAFPLKSGSFTAVVPA